MVEVTCLLTAETSARSPAAPRWGQGNDWRVGELASCSASSGQTGDAPQLVPPIMPNSAKES